MLKFRVDDFPFAKEEEKWKHNLDSFKLFDAIMEKHDIDYILGVIPKNVTRDQLEYLSSNPRAEVAMHGIDHDGRYQNEFREHQTKADIVHALASAKGLLDPLVGPVTTYIPPRNVVDRKTIEALIEVGFKNLLGGPGSDMNLFGDAASPLWTHYSFAPHFYGRSDEFLEKCSVVEQRNTIGSFYNHVVTLHFTWEINIGLDNLDRYLSALKNG